MLDRILGRVYPRHVSRGGVVRVAGQDFTLEDRALEPYVGRKVLVTETHHQYSDAVVVEYGIVTNIEQGGEIRPLVACQVKTVVELEE